jgi:hypothetical protein
METNKVGNLLGAIMISNYRTMWLSHGSQVINHMTRNKGKVEAHLANGISHMQACGNGWKIKINRVVTGHGKRSMVRA